VPLDFDTDGKVDLGGSAAARGAQRLRSGRPPSGPGPGASAPGASGMLVPISVRRFRRPERQPSWTGAAGKAPGGARFDGYSAVLIQLKNVSPAALREAITGGWLACPPTASWTNTPGAECGRRVRCWSARFALGRNWATSGLGLVSVDESPNTCCCTVAIGPAPWCRGRSGRGSSQSPRSSGVAGFGRNGPR
jgi:hypothetical protein